ncbi:hypothetical protein FWD20_02760 [Candidatus Saccharibacteria bacterium]|nr:hypothetical protein [Candidatus Saccharibacteria bacterium]
MKLIAFVIGIILILVAYVPYVRGIFKGKIRPHLITWLAWTAVTSVMVAVLFSNGGGYATWLTLFILIINIIIIVSSLHTGAKATITKGDMFCFIISLLALGAWLIVGQPLVSVILITIAQFSGFIPALRNTYRRPFDESVFTWSTNAVRYALLAVVVSSYTATTLANSIFWSLAYGAAAVFLLIRRASSNRA